MALLNPASINSPLGQTTGGVNATDGGVTIVETSVVSSAITTTAANLVTAYNGQVEITNIILKTDSTGLATGTNLQILTDNVAGQANILVETVSNLGANKTVDLNSASVTKQRTVIEQNKHVQINCTGSNCTGAGVVFIYIEYRALQNNGALA